jgi:hypothetical protein
MCNLWTYILANVAFVCLRLFAFTESAIIIFATDGTTGLIVANHHSSTRVLIYTSLYTAVRMMYVRLLTLGDDEDLRLQAESSWNLALLILFIGVLLRRSYNGMF